MICTEVVHCPFYSLPEFLPSPEKPYILPSYVEALVVDYTSQPFIPSYNKATTLDPRALQFLNVVALKIDEETSYSDSNIHLYSLSFSSM